MLTGAWVCTTADWPIAVGEPVQAEVEVELGGRLEVTLDEATVEVDHDDLLVGDRGEVRPAGGDRDPVAGRGR